MAGRVRVGDLLGEGWADEMIDVHLRLIALVGIFELGEGESQVGLGSEGRNDTMRRQ